MSDASRCEDGFEKEKFLYCSTYSQDNPHPDYAADDETFIELRNGYFDSLNHENRILNYLIDGDFGERSMKTFDYKEY